MMSFLGMLNFYRRYLRGAASILKPLTDATRGAGSKHSKLVWTKEMAVAFTAAKWPSGRPHIWPIPTRRRSCPWL